jgi:hypothetical protein
MSKCGSRHNHSVHITHHTTWQRRQQATHRWKALGSPKYGVLDLAAYLATGIAPSKRERKQYHYCSPSKEVSSQIPSNVKTQNLDLRQTRPDHRPISGTPQPAKAYKKHTRSPIIRRLACLPPSHKRQTDKCLRNTPFQFLQFIHPPEPSLHPRIPVIRQKA